MYALYKILWRCLLTGRRGCVLGEFTFTQAARRCALLNLEWRGKRQYWFEAA